MFTQSDLRNAALGTSIFLSSMGFASATKDPKAMDKELIPTPREEGSSLDTLTQVKRFSGPLEGAKPPSDGGEIQWGVHLLAGESTELRLALAVPLMALVGACAAGAMSNTRSRSAVVGGALVGAAIPVAVFGPMEIPRVVSISTTINMIESTSPPHSLASGRNVRGPYYSQTVSIPETTLPLTAIPFGTPFVEGEKVNANFYLDSENQIICWFAAPEKL